METLFIPFTFEFPHRPLALFVGTGVWGLTVLVITFLLVARTMYLLWKGCSAKDIYLHFALSGLLPFVGLHGTLYGHWALGVTVGNAPLPADFLLPKLYEISLIGFFANQCFFVAVFLGVLLIIRSIIFSTARSRPQV